ncbi:MAG: S49 family peptidase [Bacteroidales bacterium]
MSYSLLQSIFNAYWFIDESAVAGYLPIVKNIYEGNIDVSDHSEERLKHRAFVVSADFSQLSPDGERIAPNKATQPHSIVVIPLMGAITLQDQNCGPDGTVTKGLYLQDAGRNPNIDSVILKINSPGGEAHAMFNFTNSILDFKKTYGKPIVAHVDSMAASAAFGIAACCDRIVCSDTHTLVGSIGTYITIYDHIEALKAMGVKAEEIYAADSVNKNIEWRAAIAGDKKPMLKMLKVYNDRFLSIVKSGRTDAVSTEKGDPFTGATIFAMDALDMRLIDQIGNIEVAVEVCSQLLSNYSPINNTMTKISFQKAWANIAAFFSTKAEGDEITEAELVELNTEFGNRQASIDDLTKQISAKDTEISNLMKQVADEKAGNDILQAALTTTEEQRDSFKAELALRPGTAATAPNADVEIIETTPVVVLDEINEEAKKYR